MELMTYGVAETYYFNLSDVDGINEYSGTLAVGDVTYSIDGAAAVSVDPAPVYANGQYSFSLSAANLTSERVKIKMKDQGATPVFMADWDMVLTFGHPNAAIPIPLGTDISSDAQVAQATSEYMDANSQIASDTAAILLDTGTDGVVIGATSLASINSEVDTALSDYDGPTNAEMVARTRLASEYALDSTVAKETTLSTVDGKVDIIDTNLDTALTNQTTINTNVLANGTAIGDLNDFDPTVDEVIVGTNNDKTDYALSAAGVDAILDEAIGDGVITLRQVQQILVAWFAAKSSGGGTTEITFRNNADSADAVVKTVDANGNTSAVTLNLA